MMVRHAKRSGGVGLLAQRLPDGQTRKQLQRLYVIAAAGLAALVPLILFAGFWIRSELNKSQHDVEGFLSGRSMALSRHVDAELEHQLVALRAVSALPDLDVPSAGWNETATRILAVMPHWTAIALVDPASGTIVSSTDPAWPGAGAISSDALRDRRPLVLPTLLRDASRATIALYAPVVRNDGVKVGVLVGFDAADIQDITAQEAKDRDVLSTLLDGNGTIIARSRSPQTTVGRPATDELKRGIGAGPGGSFRGTSIEGEPTSGAYARSPLTGWVSLVAVDRSQLDGMSNRSVWATVAAGVLSLILAGILAVFIVHTVMERRVSDERLAASRALGELDARLLATTQEALGEQRKSSSEREVLLREIYHRVKNNLQIVQSLLRLGSRDLKADQREPFEAAVRRVGAMARVHTLLYNSPDLGSIDFKDYLDELLKELSDGFAAEERSITSVLNAHSMRVPLDTAVPLAFIAVEILTNSFRHAFPEGRAGNISVEIEHDEPFGLLRIEDDGIGFTHDPSAKRRLGLTIVRKLVQQIGGSLEEPAPGTSVFKIRFPLEDRGGEQARKRMEVASS